MEQTFYPKAFVSFTLRDRCKGAIAICLAVVKFTFIYVTICMFYFSLTMLNILVPFSHINFPTGPLHGSFTMPNPATINILELCTDHLLHHAFINRLRFLINLFPIGTSLAIDLLIHSICFISIN